MHQALMQQYLAPGSEKLTLRQEWQQATAARLRGLVAQLKTDGWASDPVSGNFPGRARLSSFNNQWVNRLRHASWTGLMATNLCLLKRLSALQDSLAAAPTG